MGRDLTNKEVKETKMDWDEISESYKWHINEGGFAVVGKPEIPNRVAEWLEKHEEQDLYCTLNILFQYVTEIDDWFLENTGKLIDAKRYGYTIKEREYVVKTEIGTYFILDSNRREWDYTSTSEDIEYATRFNREQAEAVVGLFGGSTEELGN